MNFITRNALAFISLFTLFLGVGFGVEHNRAKKLQKEVIKHNDCTADLKKGALSPFCAPEIQTLFVLEKNKTAQLAQIEAERKAAISRAQTRNENLTQRKIDDATALSKAARDGNGNIICDTACLRARFKK